MNLPVTMQSTSIPFLALLAAHLFGDFVAQTDAMIQAKSEMRLRGFLHHGVVHYLLAYGFVLIFVPELLGQLRIHAVLPILVASHLAIDLGKERTVDLTPPRRTAFFVDQVLHVGSILIATILLAGSLPPWISDLGVWMGTRRDTVLWLIVVYVATIFGGGYVVRLMLPEEDIEAGEAGGAVPKGGMYIGWLERFVTLTAVLAKSPTLIGLILTAKSIVRFKKLDSDRFAEYYLLGTFLSLALALAGGLLLLEVLGGDVVTALE